MHFVRRSTVSCLLAAAGPVRADITVTSTADSGPGSLRSALATASTQAGPDTIGFDAALNGQTVTLTNEIVVTDAQGVTVDASALAGGLKLSGNSATRMLSNNTGSNLTLKGLTFTRGNGNGAVNSGSGGGLYNGGTLAVMACTFTGNSGSTGGALANRGTAQLTNCTIANNTSSNRGGGLAITAGTLTMTHCTVTGNTATTSGGGLFSSAPATITNTIIAGNTAPSGNDVANSAALTYTGGNLIQQVTHTGTGAATGPVPIASNPSLGPLGNFDGPAQTTPPLPGSPAIDAGSTVAGLATDQRGHARVRDGNNDGTIAPDLGAFENSGPVVTTPADELDSPAGAATSLREAVRDAAPGDVITFWTDVFNSSSAPPIIFDPANEDIYIGKPLVIGSAVNGPQGDDAPRFQEVRASGGPRIFTVNSPGSVALSRLMLTGGQAGSDQSPGSGGAIYNASSLALRRCEFSGNQAAGGAGGAIYSTGSLDTEECTINSNTASRGAAIWFQSGSLSLRYSTCSDNTAATDGGAIYNDNGTLDMLSSTFHSNTATAGSGGAVFNTGSASLVHCTIARNRCALGGGIHNQAASPKTLTTANCIIWDNTLTGGGPGDVSNSGDWVFIGSHFLGKSSGNSPIGPGTIRNEDPQLAPAGYYGGYTCTLATYFQSPARNAGSPLTPAIRRDQRGFPIVSLPDAGSYDGGTYNNCNAWTGEKLQPGSRWGDYAVTADPDGDGMTNQQEWNARTDPADPASFFRITGVTRNGNQLNITFPTVTGVNYGLRHMISAAPLVWNSVNLPLIPGDGTPRTFSVPITPATEPSALYIVDVAGYFQ